MLNYIIYILLGYLVGSIPFSYLAPKHMAGIDIREHGSGNAGATNVFRVTNKNVAAVAFLGDLFKGAVLVLILKYAVGINEAVVAGGFAIIGHCYPIFLGFRGGKGVATTIGIIFMLSPIAGVITGGYMIACIAITRIVSLASITGVIVYVITMFILGVPQSMQIFSILAALFVIYRHKANISRLLKGEEKRLNFKKK